MSGMWYGVSIVENNKFISDELQVYDMEYGVYVM